MPTKLPLSPTEILAAATDALCRHGFVDLERVHLRGVDVASHRLFEDAYSIVAVIVFQSWQDLLAKWLETQASLVELMSEHLSRDDYKSWEGYLALLTPTIVPIPEQPQIEQIRYDTARVRKLVATGARLRELVDVEEALLPLLPLQEHIGDSSTDTVLTRLPALLETPDLPREVIQAVVEAFAKHEPLIPSLHTHLGGK